MLCWDTPVSMEDGDRRIDEIETGDKVWAYNTNTGEKELKALMNCIHTLWLAGCWCIMDVKEI